MALGGQMQHRVGRMGGKHPVEGRAVANISMHKAIERALGHAGDILKAGSIGQRIKVDHLMPSRNREPHHRRPDEPGPTRHQEPHAVTS